MQSHEYKVMYELEEKHAWFKVKREMIKDLFNKYCKPGSKILDVGCGTGVICKMFSAENDVVGLDISEEALRYAKKRDKNLRLVQGDAQKISLGKSRFDVVIASDVIEHVDDDYKAMRYINRSLKPGGRVIITVPAFEFLWGKDDDMLEHKRRYTKKQVRRMLLLTGFKINFINYWDTLPFPIAIIYKLINKEQSVIKFNKLINFLAYAGWRLDSKIIQHVPVPLGVSIVAVATKINNA